MNKIKEFICCCYQTLFILTQPYLIISILISLWIINFILFLEYIFINQSFINFCMIHNYYIILSHIFIIISIIIQFIIYVISTTINLINKIIFWTVLSINLVVFSLGIILISKYFNDSDLLNQYNNTININENNTLNTFSNCLSYTNITRNNLVKYMLEIIILITILIFINLYYLYNNWNKIKINYDKTVLSKKNIINNFDNSNKKSSGFI